MSSTSVKRIHTEYSEVNDSGLVSVAFASEKNVLQWEGSIEGPAGTPYSGGVFQFRIEFPSEYPFKAPAFKFVTQIFHPNVSKEGLMCIPRIEGNNWAPNITMLIVLQDVAELLKNPDVDKNTNPEACELYKSNKAAFNQRAAADTKNYADPFQ